MPSWLVLLLARGFGSGLAPVAPGTFGSIVGLAWFALLAAFGNFAFALAGTLTAIVLAVPLCHRAELLLQSHDPGSVVLDEIVAVPLCYLPWWAFANFQLNPATKFSNEWTGINLAWLLIGFVLFRLLDALKPPPIHALQKLPGGWGIVADDLAAGLITGFVVLLTRWRLS